MSKEKKLQSKKELRDIKKEFSIPRRTEIKDEITEIKVSKEAMINKDDYVVVLTKAGYIKKMSIKAYNSNDEELPVKDGDYIIGLYKINNLNTILVFTDKGNYLYVPVYEIEETKFKDLGKHVNTIVSLPDDENIISCYPVTSFKTNRIVTVFTKEGICKRANLSDFEVSRYTKPVTMMKIKESDSVVSVFVSDAKDLLCVTKNGYALRFNVKDISIVGLKASGVKGIKLTDDELVSAVPIVNEEYITLITTNGNAKRLKLSEIEASSRAKKGISIIKSPKTKKYDVLKVFNNENKDVIGILSYDKLFEIKPSEIPFFDLKSVGSSISKRELTDSFVFKRFEKVNVEDESNYESNIENELSSKNTNKTKLVEEERKEVVYEELTMSDFFDEFKL